MTPTASADFPTAYPLRERVRSEGENRPGIYRFTGPRGEVLYVGKSVRLRSRLLSYFRPDVPRKVHELLRVAADVEWEYVPNEFEALLRELRQIRAFRPRFNRQHRIDRRFAWIRITHDSAPRLVATRRPLASEGRHFGPFPARQGLPRLLRELASVVGLRDCPATTPMRFSDQPDLFSARPTPGCSRADLGTCPAPCAAGCSTAEYRERVATAARLLEGLDDAPLEELSRRMEGAAARREFERAALLRDREARIRALRDEVVLFRETLRELSFVYRLPSEPSGPDRGYLILRGRVLCSFDYDADTTEDVDGRVRAHLCDRGAVPDEMDPETREEVFLVTRWFLKRPEERARTIPLSRALIGNPDAHGGTLGRLSSNEEPES